MADGRTARVVIALLGAALFASLVVAVQSARAENTPGFQDTVVLSGLSLPTSFRFSPDGRVFVAEKDGLVKVFDSLADTTPDVFIDLTTDVYSFWDRGLLGMELAPNFPTDPSVYLLYAHDAAIGGTAPQWGTPGEPSDPCPTPPGPTDDGCVVSGRLVRVQASGNQAVGSPTVLVEDWCQQFPSHSLGDLHFGPDGSLYVSAGEGAGFNYADYGQAGNPCQDAPGGNLTLPTSNGGALRAQKVVAPGKSVPLGGAVLRVNPATGAGYPSNPYASTGDPNSTRIIAQGFRNPFRFAVRPGTQELYVGDVGWDNWEEINFVANGTDSTAENFGWPCYEGPYQQAAYAALGADVCQNLYNSGAAATPYFTYAHHQETVPGDGCAFQNGGSISGLAFNDDSNNYPAAYDGALFFADYSSNCIWMIPKGADGRPNPAGVAHFMDASGPVYLATGPSGDLFYADMNTGSIHRISYTGTGPTSCAGGQYLAEYFNNMTLSGAPVVSRCEAAIDNDWAGLSPAPGVNADGFSVRWTGTQTFAAGQYAFSATADDGVRVFVDGTAVIDQWNDQSATTFTGLRTLTAGNHEVKMEFYDNTVDAVAKLSWALQGGANQPPVASIASPSASTNWKVGDVISFSGSATDPEQGALPASALSWDISLLHCPDACHEHTVQTFSGVASGSFVAPDHENPSRIQLELTATDSNGAVNVVQRILDPQTTILRFESSPSGLSLVSGSGQAVTPFERTVVVGSTNSIGAPTPQTLNGSTYAFDSWSDGGARNHNIVAAAGAMTTFTATFAPSGTGGSCAAGQFLAEYFNNQTLTGTPVLTRCEATIDNDWGVGSPGPGVAADGFSVRWTGSPTFTAGTNTFTATADDGIRVYVDNVVLIDQWQDQSAMTFTAQRTLTDGLHEVRVEFRDNTVDAVAKVSWAGPGAGGGPCAAGQFLAEYFNNQTLTGTPVLTRCEAIINNDWGNGSPGAGVNADGFSVRWTGLPTFTAGDTTFTAVADDGMRVYVDDTILIDEWRDQPPTTFTAQRTLTAGTHGVRVEFKENGGGATAKLSWATTTGGGGGSCAAGQFLAEYFNNQTLSGTPVLTRCEAIINNDWGQAAPAPGVNADGFSVRWTGSPTFTAGTNVFSATADDGIRVYVDDVILIDEWQDQGATTFVASRTLTGGPHSVRVEFRDNTVDAVAKVSWALDTGGGACAAGHFLAEYFNNQTLTGTPVLTRCEAIINNDWGNGSPGAGVNADGFSVRWTGSPTFTAGTSTFTAVADDGIRVYVDDVILIDEWRDQAPTTFTASRALTAGTHAVRVEFKENGGGAVARLMWSTPISG